MANTKTPFERAMTLAALSGLKIALGPAFLASTQRRQERKTWVLAALGEMLLDKVGVFPPRYRPALLIPHTLAGAWVARESLREEGIDDPWAAPMGAVIAAGVASVAPMVRIVAHKALGIPDPVLGIAEDYLALRMATDAFGMTMEDVADVAKDAIEEVKEQVLPEQQWAGATY